MTDELDKLFVLPPCEEPLQLLHAASEYLVVDKPTRLLSVPGRSPKNRDCVISRLQAEYPGATAVHRLDFDTSGLMVVPLSKSALSHLSRQFQQRSVQKCYTALVYGLVEQDSGRIDLPIAPDPEQRPKYRITEEGKASVTDYRVLGRDPEANTSRVALYPVTGRSHQLRLHMQALGYPILGCGFYAHPEALSMADRLLLHATELTFTDPATGKTVRFESAPPF
ncbi:pseudouridine synthase [Marinimicrobium sp. ABcell2]|uniref:pseudouridine synthase n=1 Tax=Marinimicrobium sp. ABcell2 TaxID=3069751 RepID=UPI0027B72B5F|nr:pseudouridine synthase [Marinimicrobium sp. ABcell2]MDQ2075485.1 pseudouridine synthase [Marinimicrobium sp. ABcell2]